MAINVSEPLGICTLQSKQLMNVAQSQLTDGHGHSVNILAYVKLAY